VSKTSSAKVYLPSGKVAARYSRPGRTIDRWTRDPKLGFPKPIVIRGKRFWDEALLEQFERERCEGAGGVRKPQRVDC
jgi:hypothetical protein